MLSSILRRASARKPRIAVIGHSAEAYLAGAERSLVSIVAAIDRDRYDVCAVIPATNAEYMQAIGRYTDAIEVFPYSWWSGACPSKPETIARFAEFIRRRSIDLVHVNTITLMDPLLAARQAGIPCIVHARELIDQDDHLAGLFGLEPAEIIARIRATANFIIANSEATHRLYGVQSRSFRLYNCIDVDAFDMANEVKPGALKIGIISSNHPKKGIDAFVRLAALAASRRPELEFIVFGPHTAHIEELAQGLRRDNVQVNLRFAGYVANPVEAVRQLNVVVSFSAVAESFGRTLVEAMAARRPVIAYDRGAVPELVRHGIEGFVIPPFDIERALAHIETLADDPKRLIAMGKAGRTRASALFSPSVFATELNAIYRRILAATSGAHA
ncbi:glycosyltransferase family 4 protein [Rhodoplanes sp. Z2-YC6860]|uniref:glycosyltransferase family 4 protein n=1 Tax=Rhodoplanes sp. Z2-YC6860 TaxID=674703 RepID=UPI0018DEA441|nr:glycosyltransferase family 4 protein [Rhodoplanes sp. Z2-YC6860]